MVVKSGVVNSAPNTGYSINDIHFPWYYYIGLGFGIIILVMLAAYLFSALYTFLQWLHGSKKSDDSDDEEEDTDTKKNKKKKYTETGGVSFIQIILWINAAGILLGILYFMQKFMGKFITGDYRI